MNTLKFALRFLLRARAYTVINLLGLAFSLACCIILLRYIHRELTVDTHCVDREGVYGVRMNSGDNIYWGTYTTYREGASIDPGLIAQSARFTLLEQDFLIYDGHRYTANTMVADSAFFQLFSYPLLQGELTLDSPESALMTEEYARRVFGKENPIGKVFRFSNGKECVVKGVLAEPDNKVSIRFDLVLSSSLSTHWEKMPLEFFRFVPGADLEALNRIGSQSRPLNPNTPDKRTYQFSFLPLKEMYWHPEISASGSMVVRGDRGQLKIFMGVCGLLLLTGLLNFVNLYMVFLWKRTREYGIRKVFGASASRLFIQIYVENLLLTLVAVVVAWAFVEAFRVPISRLFTDLPSYTGFDGQLSLGLLVLLPLLSSLYPYWKLTRSLPATCIYGSRKAGGRAPMRKALLFMQYVLTSLLLVLSLYFNRQLNLMLHTEPGYRTHDILLAYLIRESKDYSAYSDESIQARISRVRQMDAKVSACPGVQAWMSDYTYLQPSDLQVPFRTDKGENVTLKLWYAPPALFDVYGLQWVEGGLPSQSAEEEERDVYVVNESALKALGYTSCKGATLQIDESFIRSEVAPIVGVVKDFYLGHIGQGVSPLVFKVGRSGGDVYQLAVYPGKMQEVLDYLRRVEKEVYGVEEFDYELYQDKVSAVYAADRQVATVYSLFALVAMIVSCMGLFGISLFDIRQRYREIAIRKAHGAGRVDLYRLLLRKYLGLLLGASCVAVPLAGLLIHYYTADFVVKASVTPDLFLLTFGVVAGVSLLTLCWQVHKATRIRPSEVMKRE